MSLKYLKNEILEPIYIMCNECKRYCKNKPGITCEIYLEKIPNNILFGNPHKKKINMNICKHFEQK